MGFLDGFGLAMKCFLAFAWIWAMFRYARKFLAEPRLKAFAVILVMSLLLGFVNWSYYGTPDLDHPDEVILFHPTPAQRNKAGTFVFLMTFVPACAGLFWFPSESPRKKQFLEFVEVLLFLGVCLLYLAFSGGVFNFPY